MVLILAHHAGERALCPRYGKPIVLASLRPCSTLGKQHPIPCLDVRAPLLMPRARILRCRSSTEQQADAQKAEAGTSDTKIKQTLADLDALLGIGEEKEEEKKQEATQVRWAWHIVVGTPPLFPSGAGADHHYTRGPADARSCRGCTQGCQWRRQRC